MIIIVIILIFVIIAFIVALLFSNDKIHRLNINLILLSKSCDTLYKNQEHLMMQIHKLTREVTQLKNDKTN